MLTAYSILPDRFEDGRHLKIKQGLTRKGYTIVEGPGKPRDERDVLVTWTVHRGYKEDAARSFEAAGGRVIVCEEAYIRIVGKEKCFALALHDHNGAGTWSVGGAERWQSFGIELSQWQFGGNTIVVREQRGIGSKVMASPPGWHYQIVEELRRRTQCDVILRYHPKSRMNPAEVKSQPSLEQHLRDARSFVTWASSDAVRALILGIPVFYCAPHWICEGAAHHGIDDMETLCPWLGDRLPAFERLAWAQWTTSEIQSGEAFDRLLGGLR